MSLYYINQYRMYIIFLKDGFEYEADCEDTKAYKGFWASVSRNFIASAKGEKVFWIANGNRKNKEGIVQPYGGNFESDEVPNLPENVKEVVVVLLCIIKSDKGKLMHDHRVYVHAYQ